MRTEQEIRTMIANHRANPRTIYRIGIIKALEWVLDE